MKKEDILKEEQNKRSKCLVYTRVMGYCRPYDSFNIGKKGEFEERVTYDEEVTQHHNKSKSDTGNL